MKKPKPDIPPGGPAPPISSLPVRLLVGVLRLTLEQVAIYAIWRWILPEFDIELPLFAVILAMVAWGAFAVVRFILATRALKRPYTPGLPSLVGSIGRVVIPLTPRGTVRVRGETWSAILTEGDRAEPGDEVTVMDMDGLCLQVRPRHPRV